MKKNEIPQDVSALQGYGKELCYAKNEHGQYETALSSGWDTKAAALENAWDVVHDRIAEAQQKIAAGQNSPILYYMEKNLMDIGILASYMNISTLRVAAHLRPWGFRYMRKSILQRYAEVFKISVEQLLDISGE